MPMSYCVFQNGQSVGTAKVSTKGLYYEINCCCSLPQAAIYKITVSSSQGSFNLGTCIKDGSNFIIHTHVPIKYLGERDLYFEIAGNYKIFTEITDGGQFPYLPAIIRSHLSYRNGKPGIWISPE